MSQLTRLYAAVNYCASLDAAACASSAMCSMNAASRQCELTPTVGARGQPLTLSVEMSEPVRELIAAYETARREVERATAEKEAQERRAVAAECSLKKAKTAYTEYATAPLNKPVETANAGTGTELAAPAPPSLDTVLRALYSDIGVLRALPRDRSMEPDDVVQAVDSIRDEATKYLATELNKNFISGFDKPKWLQTKKERAEPVPATAIMDAIKSVNAYKMNKKKNPTDDLSQFLQAVIDGEPNSITGYKQYPVPFEGQTVEVTCFAFTPARASYERIVDGALQQIAIVAWPNEAVTLRERENKRRLQPVYRKIRTYFNEEGGNIIQVANIRFDILQDLYTYVVPKAQPVPGMRYQVAPFLVPPPNITCMQLQDALAPYGTDMLRTACTAARNCDGSMDGQCTAKAVAAPLRPAAASTESAPVAPPSRADLFASIKARSSPSDASDQRTPAPAESPARANLLASIKARSPPSGAEPQQPAPAQTIPRLGFLGEISSRKKVEGGAAAVVDRKPFSLLSQTGTSAAPPPLTVLEIDTFENFKRKFTNPEFCGVLAGFTDTKDPAEKKRQELQWTASISKFYNQLVPFAITNFLVVLSEKLPDEAEFAPAMLNLLRTQGYAKLGYSAFAEDQLPVSVKQQWYNDCIEYINGAFLDDPRYTAMFTEQVKLRNRKSVPTAESIQTAFCKLDKRVKGYLELRGIVSREGDKFRLTTDYDTVTSGMQRGLDVLVYYPPLNVEPVETAYTDGGIVAAQTAYKKLSAEQKKSAAIATSRSAAANLHTSQTVAFLTSWAQALVEQRYCGAPVYTAFVDADEPFCKTGFAQLTQLSGRNGLSCGAPAAAPGASPGVGKLSAASRGLALNLRIPPPPSPPSPPAASQ